MKTSKLLSFSGVALLFIIALSGMAFKPVQKTVLCHPIVLSSPPANFYVFGGGCSSTLFCNRSSTTTLTLTTAGGCPHTWTFTNTITGCVKVFNTVAGVATLQAAIPGTTGDAITLIITDAGGGSSATYNFTAVSC